jgi:hypothetical protein
MATTIDWYGGNFVNQISPAESGTYDTLGHFGAGFGLSIRVGQYNDTSWVTNDNGTAQNGQVPNVKFASLTGCYTPSIVAARLLTDLATSEATLGIRLITDSSVQTQNSSFRAFDRVSIDNAPSGVTIKAFEIKAGGSGDSQWTTIAGTGALTLDDHTTASGTHIWYVAVTASPNSIGEKRDIGYYFETEFL